MKVLIILIFLILGPTTMAQGLFISPSMSIAYSSGDEEATSSLIGPGFGIAGGVNYGVSVFEIELKRIKVGSAQIGSDDFETEVYDTIFSGGIRLLLNDIFSIKAGISIHFIEMDVFEDSVKRRDLEDDGEYTSLYGGMGIMRKLGQSSQLYLESSLYPVSDANLYIVDMQAGIRLFL